MNCNFTFKCKLSLGDFAGFVSTLILFCILPLQTAFSQPMNNEAPMIGAEIFIEPGQTPEEIDIWYRLMKENGLSICRIRMFETYMHKPDGS